jgi:Tfp pilus assembly protein PilV
MAGTRDQGPGTGDERPSRQSGLALIELLVALVLMGMVIFLLGAYYPLASLTAVKGRDETVGAQLGASRLEQVRSRPFSWVTQANVNGSFNLAVPSNPNCDGTSNSELLNAAGACYDSAADTGVQYTRITVVTTSFSSQAKLTKVAVIVKWPQDGANCTLTEPVAISELDARCLVLSTVIVNFP